MAVETKKNFFFFFFNEKIGLDINVVLGRFTTSLQFLQPFFNNSLF